MLSGMHVLCVCCVPVCARMCVCVAGVRGLVPRVNRSEVPSVQWTGGRELLPVRP